MRRCQCSSLFFFNDTATTDIYTLSLHDALPIWNEGPGGLTPRRCPGVNQPDLLGLGIAPAIWHRPGDLESPRADRKSTRLNSSHQIISYAVFCLKKKKIK